MPKGINTPVNVTTIDACLTVGLDIYRLVVIAAYFTQPSIIFRTGGLTARPPSTFPIECVTVKTSDDLMLNGW